MFCPFAIQPHTSVYSVFCDVHAVYTTHDAKQRTGLYRGISCDCTRSTAHDTRPTQAAIVPPAPRWSVSQRRSASSTYQIPAPRPDAVQVSTAAYYNKVYKRADHASPATSRCFPRLAAGGLAPGQRLTRAGILAPSTRRSSPAAGGAEPLAACAAALFGLSPDSQ